MTILGVCHTNDQMFIDTLQDYVLLQHITELTRYRQGVNPHTLNLVLTDEERKFDELRYLAALGKGDHVCITFKLNCCTSQKSLIIMSGNNLLLTVVKVTMKELDIC